MQLFAPDILEAAHGLSLGSSVTAIATGMLLWITGWWWHRFWIVLGSTSTAGIIGLAYAERLGPVGGMRPLLAGLLMAIAAGVLSLALVRVIVFAAGGAATCLLVHAIFPPAWNEPLGWFLAGGLVSLVLFRVWTMALTSFLGTMLMGYGLFFLLDRLGKINAVAVADQPSAILNIAAFGVAVLGLFFQFMLARWRGRKDRWKEETDPHITEEELDRSPSRRPWLRGWGDYRRAG